MARFTAAHKNVTNHRTDRVDKTNNRAAYEPKVPNGEREREREISHVGMSLSCVALGREERN